MERSDIMSDKVEIKFLDKEQEGLFKPATNLAAGFDLRSTAIIQFYLVKQLRSQLESLCTWGKKNTGLYRAR